MSRYIGDAGNEAALEAAALKREQLLAAARASIAPAAAAPAPAPTAAVSPVESASAVPIFADKSVNDLEGNPGATLGGWQQALDDLIQRNSVGRPYGQGQVVVRDMFNDPNFVRQWNQQYPGTLNQVGGALGARLNNYLANDNGTANALQFAGTVLGGAFGGQLAGGIDAATGAGSLASGAMAGAATGAAGSALSGGNVAQGAITGAAGGAAGDYFSGGEVLDPSGLTAADTSGIMNAPPASITDSMAQAFPVSAPPVIESSPLDALPPASVGPAPAPAPTPPPLGGGITLTPQGQGLTPPSAPSLADMGGASGITPAADAFTSPPADLTAQQPSSIAESFGNTLAAAPSQTTTDVTAPTTGAIEPAPLGSGITLSPQGQGLTMPSLPDLADMGGAQGVVPPADTYMPPDFSAAAPSAPLGTGLGTQLSPEGQGLHLPETTALGDMGGASGVTAQTNAPLGEQSSFINAPAVRDLAVPGIVGAAGATLTGTAPVLGGGTPAGGVDVAPPAPAPAPAPTTTPAPTPGDAQPPQAPPSTKGVLETIKDNALPIAAATSTIGALTADTPPVPDDGAALRTAEEQRKLRASGNRQRVSDAFGNYNDDYYNGIAKAFEDYYTPQLNDLYGDETRRVLYQAPGGVGSSEFARQLGKVDKNRQFDFTDLSTRAHGAGEDARANVSQQKSALMTQADSAEDPQSFGDQAVSLATAAARPAPYSPITDLFGRYTALAANTALANASMGNRGGGSGYYPGFQPFVPHDPLFLNSGGSRGSSSVRTVGG